MQDTQEIKETEESAQAPAEHGTAQHSAMPGAVGLAAIASAALTACGGGGDDPAAPTAAPGDDRSGIQSLLSSGSSAQVAAWRFLNQATMGPTAAEVNWVAINGIEAWLTKQFGYTQPTVTYADRYRLRNGSTDWLRFMTFAWWELALGSVDQLRQRVVNALIEILVISMRDDTVGFRPIMAAGYMDVLARNAFGNFRELIEAVCKAPAMGAYLSHLGNQPPVPGRRIPDQNFSRELIQLFTIGLVKLNMDGTPVIDANGRPVSSTKATDIPVLSNVFTGWALDDDPAISSNPLDALRWYGDLGENRGNLRHLKPMKGYVNFHSTQAKMEAQLGFAPNSATLLDKPFAMGASPQASLTTALDIIFQHQNVAPFVARQMIQRMVTSNPTPAYVQRVATAFKAANWDMKALIRAILTDTEARSASVAAGTTYGKLREPLMRVTHLLRAHGVTAAYPSETDDVARGQPALNLNQSPIFASSVFNFFSPTYRFVGGKMSQQGKVSPEMQIATEASVVAYINAVYDIVANGMIDEFNNRSGSLNFTEELAAASSVSSLVAVINRKLFGGSMSSGLISHITSACSAATTNLDRVRTGVFLAAVSPEYLVQK